MKCILPLVDLLERNGIPYQMRNAELSFFSHRTILDIINIIKLAQNQWIQKHFCRFIIKSALISASRMQSVLPRISEEKRIPVLDVAAEDSDLNGHVLGSVRSMRHICRIYCRIQENCAIYRIMRLWDIRISEPFRAE